MCAGDVVIGFAAAEVASAVAAGAEAEVAAGAVFGALYEASSGPVGAAVDAGRARLVNKSHRAMVAFSFRMRGRHGADQVLFSPMAMISATAFDTTAVEIWFSDC